MRRLRVLRPASPGPSSQAGLSAPIAPLFTTMADCVVVSRSAQCNHDELTFVATDGRERNQFDGFAAPQTNNFRSKMRQWRTACVPATGRIEAYLPMRERRTWMFWRQRRTVCGEGQNNSIRRICATTTRTVLNVKCDNGGLHVSSNWP